MLKADDVRVVRRYRGILEAAVSAASSTLAQARSEAEALKAAAACDASAASERMIASAVIGAGAARKAAMAQLEGEVVQLMLEALSVVLQNQPRELLISQALDAIRISVAQARWVSLLVHPSNEQAALRAASQFQQHTRLTGLLTVVPTASISQDACVIETNSGTADAGVSTQIGNLEPALSEAARELVHAWQEGGGAGA